MKFWTWLKLILATMLLLLFVGLGIGFFLYEFGLVGFHDSEPTNDEMISSVVVGFIIPAVLVWAAWFSALKDFMSIKWAIINTTILTLGFHVGMAIVVWLYFIFH